MLIDLLKSMLSARQDDRPKARTVTYKLRLITIHELLHVLDKRCELMLKAARSNPTHNWRGCIESESFKTWYYLVRLLKHSNKVSSFDDINLEKCIEILQTTCKELTSILALHDVGERPSSSKLRCLNESLICLCLTELQATAHSCKQPQLLGKGDLNLQNHWHTFETLDTTNRKLPLLVFIEHMLDFIREQSQAPRSKIGLNMKEKGIRLSALPRDYYPTWLSSFSLTPKRQELDKWRAYDMHWDDKVGRENVIRVRDIAQSLIEKRPMPIISACYIVLVTLTLLAGIHLTLSIISLTSVQNVPQRPLMG
ncbi:hypothetical protein FQN49_003961 [Arthroderma sp. PD_2]|nr:hypothetical protein FQN49_003961 [Arthroderma sp. PD_2]